VLGRAHVIAVRKLEVVAQELQLVLEVGAYRMLDLRRLALYVLRHEALVFAPGDRLVGGEQHARVARIGDDR